jgi:hypothetical protein
LLERAFLVGQSEDRSSHTMLFGTTIGVKQLLDGPPHPKPGQ